MEFQAGSSTVTRAKAIHICSQYSKTLAVVRGKINLLLFKEWLLAYQGSYKG